MLVADTLDILLPVLKCPICANSTWRVEPGVGGAARVVCGTCQRAHRFERGVLWLDTLTVHDDVTTERTAVKPTENLPELGGWSEAYEGLEVTDSALQEAYLALPYGNDSSHFAQPGYFANVRRLAKEFEFIASQLPERGRLLDIGADGTWSTARLASRGLTCIALDITDHLVLGDLYQTRYPRYARINVDMHENVFVDRSFDVITAFNALHHSRRLKTVAERIAAALKPGGTLGFFEPYVQSAEQREAFGAAQTEVGISENIHTIEEWHRAFDTLGLTLTSFATSDAFCAIYKKSVDTSRLDLLRTDADGCFIDYYRASLQATPEHAKIAIGQTPQIIRVQVTNNSHSAWASRGPNAINLCYHVERLEGELWRMVAFDNPRVPIDDFLMPRTSRTFDVAIEFVTAGTYRIEFDLVHESRTWFKDRGSQTAMVTCVVS